MARALNQTKNTVVAEEVTLATSMWSRFWGLMGRKGLPDSHGLLIDPCSSIHMFFMRFPLDVVFLDDEGRVKKVVAGIKPWRAALGGGGKKALELAAGAAAKAKSVDPFEGGTWARLEFKHEINHDTLEAEFRNYFGGKRHTPKLEISNDKYEGKGSIAYKQWEVKIKLPPAEATEATEATMGPPAAAGPIRAGPARRRR